MNGRPTIDKGYCQACHTRILWIQMAPKADGSPGRRMPVNPQWVTSDGTKTLVILDEGNYGHVITRAADGVTGRESHFATCPARESFKKKKEQRKVQKSLFD